MRRINASCATLVPDCLHDVVIHSVNSRWQQSLTIYNSSFLLKHVFISSFILIPSYILSYRLFTLLNFFLLFINVKHLK